MKSRIEIITGFLGSGKTSFINAYINTFKEEDRPYVIYLEKGNSNINKICNQSYVKSLEEFEELFKDSDITKNKNILIEHNGTINLNEISDILLKRSIRKRTEFYGIYFVGNYENLNYIIKNIGEILVPFIQSSKIIILTNYKNVKHDERINVLEIIKEINTNAPIIEISHLSNIKNEIKNNKYFKSLEIKGLFKNLIKGDEDVN